MKSALAISVLLVGIGAAAVSVTAASGAATSRRHGATTNAQEAPCPAATTQTVVQAVAEARPAESVAPVTVRMPETGNAGLLPGSRRPDMQGAPACATATTTAAAPAATPTAPTATPTAEPPAAPIATPTGNANIPSIGGGAIGGGGTGPGGYGY